MKRLFTGAIVATLFTAHVFAQIVSPGPVMGLRANTTVSNIYIPADPTIFAAGKVQSATVTVKFTPQGDPAGFNTPACTTCQDWPLDAKGAMQHAADIWANTLTSDVDIIIIANWRDFGSTQYLGQAYAVSMKANFGGTSNPRYQPDTYYPFALASKMLGSDVSTLPDIIAEFNSTYTNFFFGLSGGASATQYDFVTVALHELCHGLGFTSSAQDDDPTSVVHLVYELGSGTAKFPTIFDRSMVNNTGTRLTTLQTPSTALTTFLTSNNVFFDGFEAKTANGGTNVKLFAPTTWVQGSSGSHLDEVTFTGANGLMSKGLDLQETIHNPGVVGIGIMKDIGWIDAFLFTGIEDELDIYDGALVTPHVAPVTELDFSNTYSYQMVFTDEPPYNWITSQQWKLEILYEGGSYVHLSTSNSSYFNFTLSSLPSGYKWLRNINGQIRGVITATTLDNNYAGNIAKLPVVINYKPDKPEVRVKNNPSSSRLQRWGCSSAAISFYCYGATSNVIHYKKTTDLSYVTVPVPSGMNSYTFTGLDESADYVFLVEGINSTGGTLSDLITRKSCVLTVVPRSNNVFLKPFSTALNELFSAPLVTAFPNPCSLTVRFNITSTVGSLIQLVELKNIANPNIGKTITVNPASSFVDVQVWDLPTGLYAATITDTNNYPVTITILKL